MSRQAELLDLSRSNVYYLPRPVSEADLVLMRRIDELHLNFPFAGARMLRDMLKLEGFAGGSQARAHADGQDGHRGHLPQAQYQRAASRRTRSIRTCSENLTIERPNQVWATDITYIPMKRGFVYLVAIMDWATREVLAHRVSTSMTADFCVEALEEAIAKYGTPEIFNTDQGSQFTSVAFTDVLKDHDIKISMDGKGRWVDNVFVERLWKSVKYEHVYLHAYESVLEAKQQLASYFSSTIPAARIHPSADRRRTPHTAATLETRLDTG